MDLCEFVIVSQPPPVGGWTYCFSHWWCFTLCWTFLLWSADTWGYDMKLPVVCSLGSAWMRCMFKWVSTAMHSLVSMVDIKVPSVPSAPFQLITVMVKVQPGYDFLLLKRFSRVGSTFSLLFTAASWSWYFVGPSPAALREQRQRLAGRVVTNLRELTLCDIMGGVISRSLCFQDQNKLY